MKSKSSPIYFGDIKHNINKLLMNDALQKVLSFIVSQLDSYLRLLDTSATSAIALLRNIGTIDPGTSEEGIYVTLIKLEEEIGREKPTRFP